MHLKKIESHFLTTFLVLISILLLLTSNIELLSFGNRHFKGLTSGIGSGQIGEFEFFVKKEGTTTKISGAAAVMNTRNPYKNCGNNWKFPETSTGYYKGSCALKSGESNPSVYSVTISKTGYVKKTAELYYGSVGAVIFLKPDTKPPTTPGDLTASKTSSKSVTLSWTKSTDNSGVSGYKVFRNNNQIGSASSTSYTDSSLKPDTTYSYFVKAYDDSGNMSSPSNTLKVTTDLTVKDISLPKIFSKKGSSTTDLSKVKNLKRVKSFTIEVKNKNKIVWDDLLDLSSKAIATKFNSLDKYLTANKLGVVDLDSKNLKVLNKQAKITMFDLPFVSTPKILVDGKDDPKVVSNVKYEKNILTFDTNHFSKFEAVPNLEISEPEEGFESKDQQVTLSGRSTDPTAKITATLNNKDLGEISVASKSGEFSREIALDEGENTISITATGNFGSTLSAQIKGSFQPEKPNNLLLIGGGVGASILIVLILGAGYFMRRRKKPTPNITVVPNTPPQGPPVV